MKPENHFETSTDAKPKSRAKSFLRGVVIFLLGMIAMPFLATTALQFYYSQKYSKYFDQSDATMMTFEEAVDQHNAVKEAVDIGQVTQDPDRAALRDDVRSVLESAKNRECQKRDTLTEAAIKFLRYKLAQRTMWADGMMRDIESYVKDGKKIDASSEWDGPLLGPIVGYISDGTIRAKDLPDDLDPFTSMATKKDPCK